MPQLEDICRPKTNDSSESGRRAITHFQVIERYQKHSFLECELVTGRTHKIRVHLTSINHPIVGDKVYGRRSDQNINSQLLHAYKIAFEHPKKGWMEFIAPLPEEFREILMQMRKTS